MIYLQQEVTHANGVTHPFIQVVSYKTVVSFNALLITNNQFFIAKAISPDNLSSDFTLTSYSAISWTGKKKV